MTNGAFCYIIDDTNGKERIGMYTDPVFLGMTLYDIFLLVGIVAVFFVADKMTVKLGFSVALQRIVIVGAFLSVVLGYGSAVLFQAFYNYMDSGVFEIASNTGATFFGGLIGGVAVFLIVWFFIAGRFCKDKDEPKKRFFDILDIAACCVPLAHAFGRIGCLFGGCCHGAPTEEWYGIEMHTETYGYQKVVPVQLFEAIFLFLLAAALIALFIKNRGDKKFPLAIAYCFAYGLWRFFIEYARADDVGATVVSFLSPSQLVAILLILAGTAIAVWCFLRKRKEK